MGNVVLFLSLIKNQISHLKTFEVFLLSLATSNLEELLVVNICNVIMFCVFGEIGSILFTFLISIFWYQKLPDAETGGILPVFLDNIWLAWALYARRRLPSRLRPVNCPTINWVFKYIFILLCNLLPLFIVIVTTCLIVKVLLVQRRMVVPALSAAGAPVEQPPRKKVSTWGSIGTQWASWLPWGCSRWNGSFSPYDFPFWTEVEFFITSSYTTISPYVYGIGSNLFTVKQFKK
ncbi:uncharacterized protein ora6 [Salvelinus alpinus]